METEPNVNSDRRANAGHSPTALPRWKRILRKVGAVAFGLAVALAIGELGLRSIGYSSPTFQRRHPVFGTQFKPYAEGWHRLEGKAWIEINDRGFRDISHSFAKPADTYRIGILGDSYTAAQQVELENAFPRIVERRLNEMLKSSGRAIEVINLGCSGYGTAEELLVWRHEAVKYDLDLVLVAFLTGNDITDNSPKLQPRPRPYFYIQDDDLVLDNSFRESSEYLSRTGFKARVLYWLLDHSRVAQLVNTARIGWTQRAATAPGNGAHFEDAGLNADVYREPQDEDWRFAWQITEVLLKQLNQEVQDHGARFGLVTLSNSSQVTPDEDRRRALIERLEGANLFYPDERLAAFCAARSIPCLTLAPKLWAIAKKSGEPLHGFGPSLDHGHWNERGHEAAGRLIADWVAETFLQSAE
jgi:lysophospholipase L1-like esterase